MKSYYSKTQKSGKEGLQSVQSKSVVKQQATKPAQFKLSSGLAADKGRRKDLDSLINTGKGSVAGLKRTASKAGLGKTVPQPFNLSQTKK